MGLVLGGVVSEVGCKGVGRSDEWDSGVRLPVENEVEVGGWSDDAASADWHTDGVNADWWSEGANAELRTELDPKAEE